MQPRTQLPGHGSLSNLLEAESVEEHSESETASGDDVLTQGALDVPLDSPSPLLYVRDVPSTTSMRHTVSQRSPES